MRGGGLLRELGARAIWPPLLVLALHVPLSSAVWGLYGSVVWLDEAMHLLGGVAIGMFAELALAACERHGAAPRLPGWLRAVLVIALACTAAVGWEVLEYASDRYLDTGAQPGLGDTMTDQALGAAGGGLVALFVLSRGR